MSDLLPLEHPSAWAFGACILAAVLEGLLSGREVRQRFAELQLPQPSPPLWVWSLIGLAYYALFFFVLRAVLRNAPTSTWSVLAIGLIGVLLIGNASWNWLFFRRKDLWLSFAFYVPYLLAAIALGYVLLRINSPMATWYLLYPTYLGYAIWWGYRIWRMNR